MAGSRTLFQSLYDDLRDLAAGMLRYERTGHTLQPTALVNEAFLRLSNSQKTEWESVDAFRAAAGRTIERILIDHARARRTLKRGGGAVLVEFTDQDHGVEEAHDAADLGEAIEKLRTLNPRHADVIALCFFGGMTQAQAGQQLGVSERTIRTDWDMARAWLMAHLDARE